MRTIHSYIGKFKCEVEKDSDGNFLKENPLIEEDESEVYICTKRNGQIYRYDQNILAFYCPSIKAGNRLYEKLNDLGLVYDFESSDEEVRISFEEKYIYQVAKIVGAMTRGKDELPYNKKSTKTPNNYDYNILLDGKVKKKNLSLLKANMYLHRYREEFGFDRVEQKRI